MRTEVFPTNPPLSRRKYSARAEQLWRSVMREGRPVDEVARQHAISSHRLVQLLIALSKRRAVQLRAEPADA